MAQEVLNFQYEKEKTNTGMTALGHVAHSQHLLAFLVEIRG
jgi:hypothetical protein